MKILEEHKILSSFKEWFDHTLLYEGQAFFNIQNGPLFEMSNVNGLPSYSAPVYQWVYDQSVDTAFIPTATGLGVGYIDYNHGRTISGVPPTGVNYSIKEVNIYTTTKSDQDLVFSTKFNQRSNPYSRPAITGLPPGNVVVPCAFLKPFNTRVQEFQLGGGIIQKKLYYSAICVTDSEFLLHGIGNLFTDKINSCFKILDNSALNKFGDYKTGAFNYLQESSSITSSRQLAHIDNINFSTVEHDSISKLHPNLFFGRVVFDITYFKDVRRIAPASAYLEDTDSAWLEDF
jgi:hypothetical protein